MNYSLADIAVVASELHQQDKKIVLATGFFDLLHTEHINFLKAARAAGDVLIVAVESDERARKIKGDNRPVETQSIRCAHVSRYADYVVCLGPDFDNQAAYESLMSAVRPHVYAVSSHTSHLENKRMFAAKYDGELRIVHDWNPEVSTTKLIDKGILSSESSTAGN